VGLAHGEEGLAHALQSFFVAPSCFYICLDSFENRNALPVPLLRQVIIECFFRFFFVVFSGDVLGRLF